MAAAVAANQAARAVRAGTKLHKHYLNLAKANNIFQAIYVHYDLEAEYGATQKLFLKALLDVEARKNRAWFTDDLNAVDLGVSAYTTLLQSLTDEQFEEIQKFVNDSKGDEKILSLR